MWSALNVYSGHKSAHGVSEPLGGKLKAFLKEVILSSQSCFQAECVFTAETVQLLWPPFWGYCLLRGLAQLDVSWASQPHRLHCYTVTQPEARNDSYSVAMAASYRGSGRGMCAGGNRRGWLGAGTASAALPNSPWQHESAPLALPSFHSSERIHLQVFLQQETGLYFIINS